MYEENTKYIKAQIPKGFRDFLPKQQKLRQQCIVMLQNIFESFGFFPIDTPILEYRETLLGKNRDDRSENDASDTEKQVYSFCDRGKRELAMRFDLTVPFARYMAMYHNNLPIPFNRYQIGKVFRGENTQRGRYREFVQCDFDIIGVDTIYADLTILQIIDRALILLDPTMHYTVAISHRGLINKVLKREGCEEHSVHILRILDKLRKVPKHDVIRQLLCYVSELSAERIIDFCSVEHTNAHTLQKIKDIVKDCEEYDRLCDIYHDAVNICNHITLKIDTSIMRGLNYYTGFVLETFLDGSEDIGSVCSGGRYNTLVKRFTKADLPGVGASIGLDRFLSIFNKDTIIQKRKTVLFYGHDQSSVMYCQQLLSKFHERDIIAEVCMDAKALKHAFKYADKIMCQFMVIVGDEEMSAHAVTIKHMESREQKKMISVDDAIRWIQSSA